MEKEKKFVVVNAWKSGAEENSREIIGTFSDAKTAFGAFQDALKGEISDKCSVLNEIKSGVIVKDTGSSYCVSNGTDYYSLSVCQTAVLA